MKYRLGVDVGGTFTDFLLIDVQGKCEIYKTPSTPKDQSIGFMKGLQEIAEARGLKVEDFAKQVELIVHGTTITTNAVLTLNGAKLGLLTTKGFRDAVEMRRGVREKMYDNRYTAPKPLVPRYLRRPVEERVNLVGEIVTPIKEEDVREAIELFKEEGVEAVAISFMHSYANPENERIAADIVRKEFPEAYLTLSSEILPQIRFYDRSSTACFNSYVGPLLKSYIESLIKKLSEVKFEGILLLMQSNGGVISPETAILRAAGTLLSGPAGGAVAGIAYAGVQDYDDCITIDMGGTSFDTCLIKDKTPVITTEGKIDRRAMGLPMLHIHTIGAGGGTVAWIDAGSFFRTGPQSMGAEPGPACYDLGGEAATCTDCDLVLGYLNKDFFLGGKMKINYDKAWKAIKEKIADPVKMEVIDAAAGMYDVINVNMATAIREISVQQGWDPRDFPLVVAGGAGAVHAGALALELEVPAIIIPKESSVFCATGMLLSDLRHDFVRTHRVLFRDIDKDRFIALFKEMEDEGRKILEIERVEAGQIKYDYFLDVRYVGEYYEIKVPITGEQVETGRFDLITGKFHQLHDKLYGYHLKDVGTPLELINLRLVAWGITPKPKFKEEAYQGEDSSGALKGRRRIYLTREKRFEEAKIYDGLKLGYGSKIEGPAVVEQPTTTILVLPEFDLLCDKYGSFTMYLKPKEAEVKRRIQIGGYRG